AYCSFPWRSFASRFYPGRWEFSRHRTEAMQAPTRLKETAPSKVLRAAYRILRLGLMRCLATREAIITRQPASVHSLATRPAVITQPMVLAPSFITLLALITLPLALGHCSATPLASRTRLLVWKRSLQTQPDSITPRMVLSRFRETQRETITRPTVTKRLVPTQSALSIQQMALIRWKTARPGAATQP